MKTRVIQILLIAGTLLLMNTLQPLNNPTNAQAPGTRPFNLNAPVLDNGMHPCAGSRLYVVVTSSISGAPISRPFIAVAVNEHQVVDGWLFPAKGDLIPQLNGLLLPFDETKGQLVYLEGVRHAPDGLQRSWHWAAPQGTSCYSGDTTPPGQSQ